MSFVNLSFTCCVFKLQCKQSIMIMTRKMFFIELGNKRAQSAWLMIRKLSFKIVLNVFYETYGFVE